MPLCAASHLDFTLTPASTRIHISSPKPVVPMAGCRTVNSFQFECPPVIRRTRPWRFEGVLEVAELSMPATCTVHAEVFGLHVPVGDAQPLQPGQKIPVIAGFADARLRTGWLPVCGFAAGFDGSGRLDSERTSGDSNLVRSVFDHWFWTTRSLAAFLIGWAGLVLWFHVPLFVNLMLDGSRIAPIAGGLLIAAPMLLMQKLIARWSYPVVARLHPEWSRENASEYFYGLPALVSVTLLLMLVSVFQDSGFAYLGLSLATGVGGALARASRIEHWPLQDGPLLERARDLAARAGVSLKQVWIVSSGRALRANAFAGALTGRSGPRSPLRRCCWTPSTDGRWTALSRMN